MAGNQIPIIRTTLPYLRDEYKEYYKNYYKELEEKNMTREDRVREIFLSVGLEIDFDTLTFKEI